MAPCGEPSWLDSCARLHLGRHGRLGSYIGCGIAGVVLGAALVVALAGVTAVPVSAGAALTAVVATQLGFLLGIKVMQVITGAERIVMYEQMLAALAATAAALALQGAAVWPGVDLAAAGIMAFLALARLGCLRVGCCHGRPHPRGIAYGPEHAAAGFPSLLVGVRLYPVQLVEAGVAAVIAGSAAWVTVRPHAPGEITALVLGLYGVARFGIELRRGDWARPHWLGLSEAQWFALGLLWIIAVCAQRGGFAWPGAYLAGAVGLTIGAGAIAVARRWRPRGAFALGFPQRLAELAEALGRLRPGPGGAIAVIDTPAGLRLSGDPAGGHLALSGAGLDAGGATVVAGQVAALTGRPVLEVRAGRTGGLFHLLFRAG